MDRSDYVKTKKALWLLGGVVLAILSAYLFCPKPELVQFTSYSKAFFDREGKLLRITLAEDERYRLFAPLENISNDLINATVLYEDKDFYRHRGIDFSAIFRAFWTTYITKRHRIGASTITMQVARLRWNIASNTVPGKLQQIIRAIQLNRHYSKNEILQAYLNLAPYGRNIEGIAAASLIYFNKKANELSLPEALTLSVIPQNPNRRTPTNNNGYQKLILARDILMRRWFEVYPSDRSKEKYFDLPLKVRSIEELPFTAPHFTQYVDRELSRWDSGYILTSLDNVKQSQIESIVSDYISSRSRIGINNAAVLLINYKSMEIEAMLGSADFYNADIFGQVNGVLAKRSPGSALKPFVYGLAIDDGLIHPMTLMRDSPRKYGGFTPENYDKQFLGPILAKDALTQSRNVPAVDLQARLSKQSFYAFLNQAEISGLKKEEFYGLALALGGGEVSMLELVRLYAMLANLGRLQKISFVQNSKIEKETRMLSAEASFLILYMLKDNPPPDNINYHVVHASKNDIAWKTGTSWAFRDAWAIGISGDYVVAVWIGNFDGSSNDAFIGRTAAGPLLFSIFDAVSHDKDWTVKNELLTASLNVKQIEMCKNTGDLPGKYCPSTIKSWFIPGVSPIKVSNIYRAIPIDKNTGFRECWHEPKETELKVYEFWPSDFMQIFKLAGISLKNPPAYSANCSLNQKSASGQQPIISSPQPTLEYVVRHDDDSDSEVPLSAIVDPDVNKLFWFVNDSYVGTAKPGSALFWKGKSGHHIARVVDDSGRSASTPFIMSNIN